MGNYEMIRLNKYLAESGVASRRKSDELIAAGKVSVNGAVVTELGITINPEADVVSVNGEVIVNKKAKVYVLYYKPRGVISTTLDTHDRATVVEGLEQYGRVYPVGRLDKDSEGLMLLTNDGDLAYRLTHPKYQVPKKYLVTMLGKIKETKLEQLRKGVLLEDGVTAPARVSVVQQNDDSTEVEVVLYEGKKREIRRMCAALHIFVLNLKRVGLGILVLGELLEGKYRELKQSEVKELYTNVGL